MSAVAHGRSKRRPNLQGLIQMGKLTAIESVELGKQVIMKNKIDTLEQWIEQDKLECSAGEAPHQPALRLSHRGTTSSRTPH